MDLPYSQACENNKTPILDRLTPYLQSHHSVFEIGSGTGQHAVHFAQALPHIIWQTADVSVNVAVIQRRVDGSNLSNLPPTRVFDAATPNWPSVIDCVFSANTAHIMGWPTTQNMVRCVAEQLMPNGLFFLYGPFKFNGQYTSDSNREFDRWLKQINPRQGIRDFEAINDLARQSGMTLLEDCPMPANNRMLIWTKT